MLPPPAEAELNREKQQMLSEGQGVVKSTTQPNFFMSIRSYYIQFMISIFFPHANMKLGCGRFKKKKKERPLAAFMKRLLQRITRNSLRFTVINPSPSTRHNSVQ